MKKQTLTLAIIVIVVATIICVRFKDSFFGSPDSNSVSVNVDSSFDSKLPELANTAEAEPALEQATKTEQKQEEKPVQAQTQTPAPANSTPPTPTTPVTPVTPTIPQPTKCTAGGSATSISLSNQVLDLVNITRAASELTILNCKNVLIPLGETRAQETIALFSHTRPNGSQWYTLDPSIMNGENLAIGYGTAQTVFDAWMASPGHKANILRPEFRSMGIGYFYTDSPTDVPAALCQDRDGVQGNEETECDLIYHYHIAQIFSIIP